MHEPNYTGLESLLESFLNHKILNYEKTRNFSFSGKETLKNVSGLSPYISRGLLKEKRLLKKVLGLKKKSDKFIQEIFWRIYWQGWLENHSGVWENYKSSIKELEENNYEIDKNYKEATTASTTIEPFNDWVNILQSTGYLHNHVRMWFASIWIFYLGIPWQLGAKFFYENLLDRDVASNLLSWRWVAGLQTKGKRYIASEDNINKYTFNKYRGLKLPNLVNIEHADQIDEISTIKYNTLEKNYDDCAVLINENNLNEDLLLQLNNKIKVLIFVKYRIKNLNTSKTVHDFQKNLIEEFKNKYISNNIYFKEIYLPDETDNFMNILKKYSIKNIVFDYLRCGYEKDILLDTVNKLNQSIIINEVLDNFYLNSWRHCFRGFFKFKEKIPTLIKELN